MSIPQVTLPEIYAILEALPECGVSSFYKFAHPLFNNQVNNLLRRLTVSSEPLTTNLSVHSWTWHVPAPAESYRRLQPGASLSHAPSLTLSEPKT